MYTHKIVTVISKFQEDTSWSSSLQCPVLVYDKSLMPIPNSIPCDNIGREAETLLKYITSFYTNLPQVTLFMQGDPRGNPVSFSYEEVVKHVNSIQPDGIKTATPLLSWLGGTDVDTYWCKRVATVYRALFGEPTANVLYSSGAQYALPRASITCRPLELYTALHSKVVQYGNNTLDGNDDSIVHGIDAWTMEILWGSIFNPAIKLHPDYIARLGLLHDPQFG